MMEDSCPDPAPPTAVDLFAGAGGASLGLEWAGFDVVAAVDTDEPALRTHRENFHAETICHDLSEVRPDVLPASARSPDFVHGSPPCKGFSVAGGERSLNDPRNAHVFNFIEWLGELEPAAATMENVTGMLNISRGFMGRVTEAFRGVGYEVRYKTLNAADYGVPQTRERVITIAVRSDVTLPSRWFPPPTHAEAPTSTLDGQRLKAWVTVGEAIGIEDGEAGMGVTASDGGRVGVPDVSRLNEASVTQDGASTDDGVPNVDGVDGRVAGDAPPEEPPNHDPEVSEQLADLNSGESLHGQQAYTRLPINAPSPTLTHNNGVPAVHPTAPRVVSPRKMATLQSFPRIFRPVGTRRRQYEQIGNAVPPLLQYHIADHLREVVEAVPSPTFSRPDEQGAESS